MRFFKSSTEQPARRRSSPPACATTWRCRWWARSACPTAATSAPRWRRSRSSRRRRCRTRSCAPRSSSSSWCRSPTRTPRARRARAVRAKLQPMAADDVAAALAEVVRQAPLNGACEVAGPQAIPLDELIGRVLRARKDPREVVKDDEALYFGARLDDASLTPGARRAIGKISLEQLAGRPRRRLASRMPLRRAPSRESWSLRPTSGGPPPSARRHAVRRPADTSAAAV